MSKKKNKFKKKKSFSPQAQVTATPPVINVADNLIEEVQTETIEAPKGVDNKREEIKALDEKYRYVRRDVRQLLITIAILAILFVGIYILGQKTAVLSNFGDWVHRVGNFQV